MDLEQLNIMSKNLTRTLILLLCIVAALVMCASVMPGSYSDDAFYMVSQFRKGQLTDHHAPLYVLLFGTLSGLSNIVLFNILSYFFGVYLLVEIARNYMGSMAWLVFLFALTPLCIYELHYAQKDSLIRNAILIATAAAYIFVNNRSRIMLLITLLALAFAITGRVTGYVLVVPFAVYLCSPYFSSGSVKNIGLVLTAIVLFSGFLYVGLNYINYKVIKAEKVLLDRHFGVFVQCSDIFAIKLRQGDLELEQLMPKKYIDEYWKFRKTGYVNSAEKNYCRRLIKTRNVERNDLWLSTISQGKMEYIRHHLDTYWRYWSGEEALPLRYTEPSVLHISHGNQWVYEPRFPTLRSLYFDYQSYILTKFSSTIVLFFVGVIATLLFFYQSIVQKRRPSYFAFLGAVAIIFSSPLLVVTGIVLPRYMFSTESLLVLSVPFGLHDLYKFSRNWLSPA
jgi:hypothetical protein